MTFCASDGGDKASIFACINLCLQGSTGRLSALIQSLNLNWPNPILIFLQATSALLACFHQLGYDIIYFTELFSFLQPVFFVMATCHSCSIIIPPQLMTKLHKLLILPNTWPDFLNSLVQSICHAYVTFTSITVVFVCLHRQLGGGTCHLVAPALRSSTFRTLFCLSYDSTLLSIQMQPNRIRCTTLCNTSWCISLDPNAVSVQLIAQRCWSN